MNNDDGTFHGRVGSPFAVSTIDIAKEIADGVLFLHSQIVDIDDFALIGSALYRPDAKDVDFAVMLRSGREAMPTADRLCMGFGFEHCGEYDGAGGFWCSLRRGKLNLMLTHSRKFYDGYRTAMEVCKVLNVDRKDDRIAVCKVVRDGLTADLVRPWLSPTPTFKGVRG